MKLEPPDELERSPALGDRGGAPLLGVRLGVRMRSFLEKEMGDGSTDEDSLEPMDADGERSKSPPNPTTSLLMADCTD